METRRERHPAETRSALVDVAVRLFAERGYAATALEAIVTGAEVSKGALYHHFSGKQAIFEAALEQVEQRATLGVAAAADGHDDPWEQARAGLRAFLHAVEEPDYRQIVVADGPSVLGPERIHEHEARSTYAVVRLVVRSLLAGEARHADEATLDTATRLCFGAISGLGGSVVADEDPSAAATRVKAAVDFVLAGLRQVVDGGVAAGAVGRPPR